MREALKDGKSGKSESTMSLFKKLKDRLFTSSSRLDAGLEAIVEEGLDEADATEASNSEVTAPEVSAPEVSAPEVTAPAPAAAILGQPLWAGVGA